MECGPRVLRLILALTMQISGFVLNVAAIVIFYLYGAHRFFWPLLFTCLFDMSWNLYVAVQESRRATIAGNTHGEQKQMTCQNALRLLLMGPCQCGQVQRIWRASRKETAPQSDLEEPLMGQGNADEVAASLRDSLQASGQTSENSESEILFGVRLFDGVIVKFVFAFMEIYAVYLMDGARSDCSFAHPQGNIRDDIIIPPQMRHFCRSVLFTAGGASLLAIALSAVEVDYRLDSRVHEKMKQSFRWTLLQLAHRFSQAGFRMGLLVLYALLIRDNAALSHWGVVIISIALPNIFVWLLNVLVIEWITLNKAVVSVRKVQVWAGDLIDQIIFEYSDGSQRSFGKQGGVKKASWVVPPGEFIVKFNTRVGDSQDACSFETSGGHKSPPYGNEKGGTPQTFQASSGHHITALRMASERLGHTERPIGIEEEETNSKPSDENNCFAHALIGFVALVVNPFEFVDAEGYRKESSEASAYFQKVPRLQFGLVGMLLLLLFLLAFIRDEPFRSACAWENSEGRETLRGVNTEFNYVFLYQYGIYYWLLFFFLLTMVGSRLMRCLYPDRKHDDTNHHCFVHCKPGHKNAILCPPQDLSSLVLQAGYNISLRKDFQILEKIGEGSYGLVVKAQQTSMLGEGLNKECALKLQINDASAEAKLHSTIGEHPFIVKLIHFWNVEGKTFTYKTQATHTFEPGEMGITYDEEGVVREISRDGQASAKCISEGDQIVKVGTEEYSERYSKDAVKKVEHGKDGYEVTFKVSPSKQNRQSRVVTFKKTSEKQLVSFVSFKYAILMESIPISMETFIEDERTLRNRDHDNYYLKRSVAEMRNLGAELADVLTYLHERDIVYRDLKPDNVLVRGTERCNRHICLIDFGKAKKYQPKDAFFTTKAGNSFAAPELWRNRFEQEEPYTNSVDVWAYGVTLLMMLLTWKIPDVQVGKRFHNDKKPYGLNETVILGDIETHPAILMTKSASGRLEALHLLTQVLNRDDPKVYDFKPGDMGLAYDDTGYVQNVTIGGQADRKGIKEGNRVVDCAIGECTEKGIGHRLTVRPSSRLTMKSVCGHPFFTQRMCRLGDLGHPVDIGKRRDNVANRI